MELYRELLLPALYLNVFQLLKAVAENLISPNLDIYFIELIIVSILLFEMLFDQVSPQQPFRRKVQKLGQIRNQWQKWIWMWRYLMYEMIQDNFVFEQKLNQVMSDSRLKLFQTLWQLILLNLERINFFFSRLVVQSLDLINRLNKDLRLSASLLPLQIESISLRNQPPRLPYNSWKLNLSSWLLDLILGFRLLLFFLILSLLNSALIFHLLRINLRVF